MYKPNREIDVNLKEFEKAVKRLLITSDGKHVQQYLYDEYVTEQAHTPGDPFETAFKDGQRSVAWRLIEIANEEGNV